MSACESACKVLVRSGALIASFSTLALLDYFEGRSGLLAPVEQAASRPRGAGDGSFTLLTEWQPELADALRRVWLDLVGTCVQAFGSEGMHALIEAGRPHLTGHGDHLCAGATSERVVVAGGHEIGNGQQ